MRFYVFTLSLAEHRPNRISHGIKYSGFEFFGALGSLVLLLWVVLIVLSLLKKKHINIIILPVTSILLVSLFWALQLTREIMLVFLLRE